MWDLGVKLKRQPIFFLVIFFYLICPVATNAFYHMDNHADEMRIDNSEIVLPTQDNNLFCFYDNFSYPAKNEYLIKKKSGFVSMNQVEINMPLKILPRNLISIEDSIDRMLLANLKLNQLIEQYTQLQEKAKSLLTDPPDQAGNQDIVNGSIEEERKKLFKEILHWNQIKPTSQEDVLIDSLSSKEKKFSVIPGSGQVNGNTSDYSSIRSNSSNISRDTGVPSSSLPWLFFVIMNILKYIKANRIELLLYLIFFSAGIILIRLQLKQ